MSGSLGFGGSKQKSNQVQQSGGNTVSESTTANQSTSAQGNQSTSATNVWGEQYGALRDLYAQSQGLMNGSSPYGQQAGQVGQAGQQAWMQQLTPGANPYFDQAVQASIDQATESFKRGTLADLDARAAGVGQLGSSRDRLATGEAAGLFGQSIAQTAAQQRAQQYSADQERVLQAIGMTGNMQQSAYSPLSVAASLIGGPTVLQQSQSSGWGTGQSSGSGRSSQTSNQWGSGYGNASGNAFNMSTSGGIKSS
jgi:hypothetical protein